VEWLIVAGLALACVCAAMATRAEWHRAKATGNTPALAKG
jgi:hypothetical protein